MCFASFCFTFNRMRSIRHMATVDRNTYVHLRQYPSVTLYTVEVNWGTIPRRNKNRQKVEVVSLYTRNCDICHFRTFFQPDRYPNDWAVYLLRIANIDLFHCGYNNWVALISRWNIAKRVSNRMYYLLRSIGNSEEISLHSPISVCHRPLM